MEKQDEKSTFTLFYRMAKSLWDSVRYLFHDPTVNYNKLLVVARKAEGEGTKVNQQQQSKQKPHC